MKTIIQSFSDLITNSSSEVFVSLPNEDLINILKDWGIEYKCYNTEEELRKAVKENPWDFEGITIYNPYQDYCVLENLLKVKTDDQIWEFFKDCYIGLIGKIIVDVDRDYLYCKHRDFDDSIYNYIKH